ncbi:hypothetical protein VTN77DRAFT_2673 [Rasamsonia byssochlamydoides]|uniref:uncharacterized protein n=1 Tax=Rasamsonia byssochlamydoides TaxID=89139 RepID=UPI0037426B9F
MSLKTENRDNYGRTSRKFSCGHEQEDPHRPFPPSHRYGLNMEVGNEIKFSMKCMQCDLHEVCQEVKNLRKDADVDLEAISRVKDANLRREMREKVTETTRTVQKAVVTDFEARWNEKPPRRDTIPALASRTTLACLRLNADDKFLDIDRVTTLEELMVFMESVNQLAPEADDHEPDVLAKCDE